MMPHETFAVRALWQSRVEDAASLALRFRDYMTLSRGGLPSDTRWYGRSAPDTVFDIEREPQKLEPFIAEGFARHDDGRPWPALGYSFALPTLCGDPSARTLSAVAKLSVGSNGQNVFRLFTDNDLRDSTDPRLISYDAIKTHVLAVVRSFEPEWCEAAPLRLADYYDQRLYKRPPMGLAWMIWFSPPLASLIEPPIYASKIIERDTDGSVFMATSKETFDRANTTHLEQARAIHRQIDPLNYTLPFDGLSGRSDRVPPFPKL